MRWSFLLWKPASRGQHGDHNPGELPGSRQTIHGGNGPASKHHITNPAFARGRRTGWELVPSLNSTPNNLIHPYRRQALSSQDRDDSPRGGFKAVLPNPRLKFIGASAGGHATEALLHAH